MAGDLDFSDLEEETHFDLVEIIGFYEQFQALATPYSDNVDKKGITKESFKRCLGTVGTSKNIIIDRMFEFYDCDHNGYITFDEMVLGLSVLSKGTLEERVYSNC
jgi:hypothetical protein